ncbi:MAG: metal ABC transporter permease [Candidatus Margulisiibacteriota bacterium]
MLFGQAVVNRGIIFIDLALAQWAALGYLVSHHFHLENSLVSFIIAFLFSTFGGVILIILKPYFSKVNFKEAIIGVIYILGSALAITLISTTGMEGHHLDEMLSGHLLFTSNLELISSIVIYLIAASLLIYFKNKLNKQNSKLFDFIFYTIFALVVTSSVKLVGILLVFSYLVIPILIGIYISHNQKNQILIGWSIGALCSVLGLGFSLLFDIPPSYSIILCMTSSLFLSILIKKRKL